MLPFVTVDFLIDTGADFTTLSPGDASRIWPDYTTRSPEDDTTTQAMQGIGGSARFVRRSGDLRFLDEDGYALMTPATLWVASPRDTDLWGMPSPLGRDVLQSFALIVDARAGVVGLTL